MTTSINKLVPLTKFLLFTLLLGVTTITEAQESSALTDSGNTIYVNMAAIDQPFMYNRMGAAQPTGMIFALVSDLDTTIDTEQIDANSPLLGKVRLREGKRPRPIVLRANVGDVLHITFTNLLAPFHSDSIVNAYNTKEPATISQADANGIYPETRAAGVHILGTEMVNDINDDGSYSGNNASSLANPGETKVYKLFVPEEGVFMLYSTAAPIAQRGLPGGQLTNGLFGSLNVQPQGAEWYRSQVTEADLDACITYYEQISPNGGDNKKLAKNEVPDIYDTENIYPIIDYNTTDANGKPILKMYRDTTGGRILVHTDLTAIITGPGGGNFKGNDASFDPVPASPDRRRPYREFGIHYHESPFTVQAFSKFYDDTKNVTKTIMKDGAVYATASSTLNNVLRTGVDNFSINYGSGGIGAEIYANRIGVGPMADCYDCAYEEFFLSAWSVGDPATVVDIPANASALDATNVNGTDSAPISQQNQFLWQNGGTNAKSIEPDPTLSATKVLYPDDPSNVYHSYMNDHVKFRITHAGAGITHVHHQHAHQWLHSPDSADGHYLDSQAINPGSSYTLEMVYNGSGNLNKTVGDQIFHCHFYPHFAQGMWAMWRVHDVLELGTKLDEGDRAAANSRALPDGEIKTGTPIPGLVPIPKRAMAPVPSKIHIVDGNIVINDLSRNPGFPFFIPGVAGSRPPHPPMDFAEGEIYNADGTVKGVGPLDGGLPRSVMYKAEIPFSQETPFDWTKIITDVQVIELPNEGTAVEKVAMKAHATRNHRTLTPEGDSSVFFLNGLPPVAGAPFADPAIDLMGNKVGTKRTYKAANIQLDVVLNKKGWHYPQQRIISLWGDVASNIEGIRAPEPFYFRANSKEYIEYWHTNLVPEYYELDDYQVRTPTDILGQHIHLVKFDVTSSDGAANGYNYEDGTYAPDLVVERIHAINEGGKRYTYQFNAGVPINYVDTLAVNTKKLEPHEPNPIWGEAPAGQDWRGAQTTIQRWYADPLINGNGDDRTLRTVFTHDHFGPSTHQQIGLYAGLLVEPFQSTWIDPVTGDELGSANNGATRTVLVDGENMTVSDGGPTGWQANIVTQNKADSYREFMLEFQDNQQAYLPGSIETLSAYPDFPEDYTTNPGPFDAAVKAYTGWLDPLNVIKSAGYPELVSNGGRGTYSMNYRNEPMPMRASNTDGTQASGIAGDLAYVLSSNANITRSDAAWNSQPVGGSLIPGSNTFKYPKDPIGPDMQPTDPYTPLFRAYENDKIQIRTLVGAHVSSHFFNVNGVNWLFEPSNVNSGYRSTQNMGLSEHFEMNFQFPVTDKTNKDNDFTDYLYQASASSPGTQAGLWGLMRAYDTAQDDIIALPNNDPATIANSPKNCGCPETGAPERKYQVTAISIDQFNSDSGSNGTLVYNEQFGNSEKDALVFIRNEQLDDFKAGNWIQEPLVLRATAGECVVVELTNSISKDYKASKGVYNYGAGNGSVSDTLSASLEVGMHAQLLSYDPGQNDGMNVGFNKYQTVAIDSTRTYKWYAGKWIDNKPVPVEFGSVVLSAPDPLEQYTKGLFGALIIEPEGTSWIEDEGSPSSARVFKGSNFLFREFVMQTQDNIIVNSSKKNSAGKTYSKIGYAVNYRSAPLANYNAEISTNFNNYDIADYTSNSINGGNYPETPRFVAKAGQPMRIRLVHPGGGTGNPVTFNLHGHVWQEEPYIDGSKTLGDNRKSQWFGFRDQIGPFNSFDLLIDSAGGENKVTGDYLYNSMVNLSFQGGIWGILSVTDGEDAMFVDAVESTGNKTRIEGAVTTNPDTGEFAKNVFLNYGGNKTIKQDVNPDGTWTFANVKRKKLEEGFEIRSSSGALLKMDSESLAPTKMSLKVDPKRPAKETKEFILEENKGISPHRVEIDPDNKN